MMNGARALLESLRQEGVEVVFGYPGGAVLTLYDEVYKMKFPHILTRHERGPRTRQTAMRAPRARSAWSLRPRGRARRIS